jgi:hypothetical protein
MHVYVCMHACMCAPPPCHAMPCMHVCAHAAARICMYVCVRACVRAHACMHVCTHKKALFSSENGGSHKDGARSMPSHTIHTMPCHASVHTMSCHASMHTMHAKHPYLLVMHACKTRMPHTIHPWDAYIHLGTCDTCKDGIHIHARLHAHACTLQSECVASTMWACMTEACHPCMSCIHPYSLAQLQPCIHACHASIHTALHSCNHASMHVYYAKASTYMHAHHVCGHA